MGLGFGKQRLIERIVSDNWDLKEPRLKKFSFNELLYIVQEMDEEEGKNYFQKRSIRRGHAVFRAFTKHLLYRNLANFDSMILITSEKGQGKSSAAMMLARYWCSLIGIRFNPERHMAYNNADVMNKIDSLRPFEPLVCVSGDSLIIIKKDNKIQIKKIKNLINMNNYKVLSYNIKTNGFEFQKPTTGAVYNKKDIVYDVEFENGLIISATKEHKFLTKNRGYVKTIELTENDEIISFIVPKSKVKKITKRSKQKVYDIVGMPNGNFVCNNTVISNCDEAVRFASSCIVGETQIKTLNGQQQIKDLVGKQNFEVYSYNEKVKKEEIQIAGECIYTGEREVFEIETEDGKKIQASKEHKFLTTNGWKTVEELKEGDNLVEI